MLNNDKNIIKIVSIILILSILSLFIVINTDNNVYRDPDLFYAKCANGSIDEFTSKDLLVCGEISPMIQQKQIIRVNFSIILENVT